MRVALYSCYKVRDLGPVCIFCSWANLRTKVQLFNQLSKIWPLELFGSIYIPINGYAWGEEKRKLFSEVHAEIAPISTLGGTNFFKGANSLQSQIVSLDPLELKWAKGELLIFSNRIQTWPWDPWSASRRNKAAIFSPQKIIDKIEPNLSDHHLYIPNVF